MFSTKREREKIVGERSRNCSDGIPENIILTIEDKLCRNKKISTKEEEEKVQSTSVTTPMIPNANRFAKCRNLMPSMLRWSNILQ